MNALEIIEDKLIEITMKGRQRRPKSSCILSNIIDATIVSFLKGVATIWSIINLII